MTEQKRDFYIQRDLQEYEDPRPDWLKGKYGMLSDRDIRGCLEEGIIKIEPLDLEKLEEIIDNSCKIDFHLGNVLTGYVKGKIAVIKLSEPIPRELQEDIYIRDGESHVLHQGDHFLAKTKERLVLPTYIAARIEGKSSVARKGIKVEAAAVFDAGWDGIPTLELKNEGPTAIEVAPGDEICAFTFHLLTSPALKPYQGRYQNQSNPRY